MENTAKERRRPCRHSRVGLLCLAAGCTGRYTQATALRLWTSPQPIFYGKSSTTEICHLRYCGRVYKYAMESKDTYAP